MTLDLDTVVGRLLAWGVVDEASIVAGDLEVSGAARRNLSLRVERRRGPSFLIKRPDPASASTRRTLGVERRFYAFCREEPRAAAVVRYMARARLDLPPEAGLVLDLVVDGRPLWREVRSHPAPRFPLAPARVLGTALGTLHATFRLPGLAADPRLAVFPDGPPSVLAVHRPYPGVLRRLSPANRRLYRIVQREAGVCEALDRARAGWRVETVVHGDLRSDNVLVVSPAAAEAAEILLVDWELARRGDAAWDVGGVLQDFVLFWLLGMPLRADLGAGERVGAAEYPLTALRPALRAFWDGYLGAAGLGRAEAQAVLDRALVYSAARLIQSAWEHSRRAERLSSLAVLLLQLAVNLLADPANAGGELYGLSAEPAAA